jgi:hypothetical protein
MPDLRTGVVQEKVRKMQGEASMMNRKERMAIRGVFQAICKTGVEVNSVEEADAAIELAARMLSYVTGEPKMTIDQLKPKMLQLMLEDLPNADTMH